ncbi:MAG: response regulator [Nitrospiraceae bacterium]
MSTDLQTVVGGFKLADLGVSAVMRDTVIQTKANGEAVRVLVVDDSAFMRKSLSGMLDDGKRIQVVGVARNGEEAVQQVHQLKPDVVTMDNGSTGHDRFGGPEADYVRASDPRADGQFFDHRRARNLQALEYGAVDFVPKQLDGVASKIAEIQKELVLRRCWQICGAAAQADPGRRGDEAGGRPGQAINSHAVGVTRGFKLVAIGCSTGRRQALFEIMPTIPADFPQES